MKFNAKKIINLILAAAMTVSCFGQAVIASDETTETESYMLYDQEFDKLDNSMINYFPNDNSEKAITNENCIKDGVMEVSSDTGFPYRRFAVRPNITDLTGKKNIYMETKFKYTKVNDSGALYANFIDVFGSGVTQDGAATSDSWMHTVKYSDGLTFGGDAGSIKTNCTLSPDQWYIITVKFDFEKYTFKLEVKDENNKILYNGDDEGKTVYNKRPSSIDKILLAHILGTGLSTKQYYDYIRIWDEDLVPKTVTATYGSGQELDGAKGLDLSFDATVNFSKAVLADELSGVTVTGGSTELKSLSEDGKTAVFSLSGLPEYTGCVFDIPSAGGNNAVKFTFVTKMAKEYIYRAEFNGYDDNSDTWYKCVGGDLNKSYAIGNNESLIQNGNMFLGYGTIAYSRFYAQLPQAADLSGKENVYLQTKFKYNKGDDKGGLFANMMSLDPLTASVIYRSDEGVVVGAASNGTGGTAMGYFFDEDRWYTLTMKLNYKSHTYCIIIDDGSGNIKQSPVARFTDNRTTDTLEKIYMFGVGMTAGNGTSTTHYVDYIRMWDNDAGNADVVYTMDNNEYTLRDSMIVPVNTTIKITAKNDVAVTDGIELKDENGNAVAADITASGNTVTIAPENELAYDTGYSVVIPAEIVNNDSNQIIEFKTTYDITSNYVKPNVFADKTGLKTVFLGGSLTQMELYRPVVANYIKEKFPDSTFYNSGVGGTGSQYGWMRLYRSVMAYDPDIVFVEYAVNDSTVSTTNQYMESIVRNLNKLPNPPVIIFVELPVNDLSSNDYAVTEHKTLAKEYGIPLFNVRDYVKSLYNTDSTFAEEWDGDVYFGAGDKTHPLAATGGTLYGNYITTLIEHNSNKYFVKAKSNAEVSPLTDFKDFVYYYEKINQKLNKDNANYEFTFNGTEMILDYQLIHNIDGNKGGTLEVYIDNEKKETVNTYLENTSTLYDGFVRQAAITGLSEGTHTAKLVRVDNDDDTEIISLVGAYLKKTNGIAFTKLTFDTKTFAAGQPVTVQTLYTSGEDGRKVMIAVAQYDENGKLVDVSTLNTQLSETVINKKLSLTVTPKTGDKTLKAFCWDPDTLKPFADFEAIESEE